MPSGEGSTIIEPFDQTPFITLAWSMESDSFAQSILNSISNQWFACLTHDVRIRDPIDGKVAQLHVCFFLQMWILICPITIFVYVFFTITLTRSSFIWKLSSILQIVERNDLTLETKINKSNQQATTYEQDKSFQRSKNIPCSTQIYNCL